MTNNPVGRLYVLLSDVKKRATPKKRIRHIWAECFGLNADDTAAVLAAGADVVYLIRDAHSSLESLGEYRSDSHDEPFQKIEKIFAHANLETDSPSVANQLDDGTLNLLKFIAELAGKMAGEDELDEDELERFLERVELLMDDISSSSLEQQLKVAMLDALDSIRNAIKMYWAKGTRGLVQSMTLAAGVYVIHSVEPREHAKDSEIGRYWRLVRDIAAAVQIIDRIREIMPGNTAGLLGS